MDKTHTRHALRIAFGITMLVSLLNCSTSAAPVEEWNKTFGGIGNEGGGSLQQTSDGRYILGASYEGGDAWLIKTDANGNQEWNKTFGEESGGSVQQTSDGGYILAGRGKDWAGYFYAFLIKTDENGNQQWNKTFGDGVNNWFDTVQQTSDGGYIIAGYNDSGYGGTAWLMKTDANGSYQWSKVFGQNTYEANSVQQTSDSGYIIAGRTVTHYGAGGSDVLLIKTDSNGNQLWYKEFLGGCCDDYVRSVQQTRDGGYILAGVKSIGSSYRDAWLIKTDGNGNKLWDNAFSILDDYAESVQQTSDGGYILAGYTNSGGYGGYDAWLIKTDANGSQLWNKTFGGAGSDFANSIQETSDGRYILAGTTNSYGSGGYDAWLIKFSDIIGSVHNINKGIDYFTIQSAIDDANTGDEIHVDSGTYYENINVTKRLILQGIGMPVVNASGSGNAITLSADGIVLMGFTATEAPVNGIMVTSNNNTLWGNNVSNNLRGLVLQSSSNNTLRGNNASNNSEGIRLQFSSNNTLRGNNASNNSQGIRLFDSSDNVLISNKANSNSNSGILLSYSRNNTISGNNISNNTLFGINLNISNNNNELSSTNISNNIFNNTNNFYIYNSGYSNYWNTTKTAGINIIVGSYLGGNFWGKPNGTGYSQTCTNIDGDGICDSPYVLDANNTDYLPLTSINTILPNIRYINGTVMDNSTGNSLAGVNVFANSTLSTKTNALGFYSFAVTDSSYDLKASFDITYYTNTTTVSTIGKAVAEQDIEMVKKPTGNITGSVTST